jgi:hypothetical protein
MPVPSHHPNEHQEELMLTVPVIEALCDDDLREEAIAHATPSDLVIAAVIIVRPHDEHRIHDRWVIAKRLAPLIRASEGPATIAAILRTTHNREFPWHVATQLFLDSGTPFQNGKHHTSEEVLEWLSHQPYGPSVINECALWELTRKMARWDLKRDYPHIQKAVPYVTDHAVLMLAARNADNISASAALIRASEVLCSEDVAELLEQASFVNDTAWKRACEKLDLGDVRKYAYKSDFSFARREYACSLLPSDELTEERDSDKHPENVVNSINAALLLRTVLAV